MEWRDGQPYSTIYDDVYYSSSADNPQQGLAETDYVFLQHNQLQDRFQSTQLKRFNIAETGFGSGLNFLCAAKLWLAHSPCDSTLHYQSIEKHPLSLDDLTRVYQQWPTLQTVGNALLAAYQTINSGNHHCYLFDNRIQLSLYIGDINDMLSNIQAPVDAWFLDGFAPSKNPDMWQHSLYDHMAKIAHRETTFATFTSASHVNRGLQAAGFTVKKAAGYGKKREMLYGQFGGEHEH